MVLFLFLFMFLSCSASEQPILVPSLGNFVIQATGLCPVCLRDIRPTDKQLYWSEYFKRFYHLRCWMHRTNYDITQLLKMEH